MKKIYTLSLLCFLLCFNFYFAQISFVWGNGVGSTADDFAEDMTVDNFGNSYCTGYFNSSIDFDPGPGVLALNAAGGSDVYIAKVNTNGTPVWAKRIGGTGNELVGAICHDTQNNIYVTGWFSGTADFDPGAGTYNMSSSGVFDAFVCKLDSGGNLIWAKRFGGNNNVFGNDVCVDPAGNVYITGEYRLTADLDPGAGTYNLTSVGNGDVYICKLNSLGAFVWAKTIGQSGSDGGTTLVQNGLNIFVAGWFTNTCDLDPGAGIFPVMSNGSYDTFITKFDTSGTFLWGGSMGGSLLDHCEDITCDTLGNIYATGFFEGTADFDPGVSTHTLMSAGSEDIFVVKLNSFGGYMWAKVMGGPSQDNGRAVVVANGNVFTTGFFSYIADLDPSDNYNYDLTSAGNADIFLSQLDMNGSFVAAVAMGGPGSDLGNAVRADSSGGVYIHGPFGGYTTLPADLDPGTGSFTVSSTNSSYDIFLSKYKGSARDLGITSQQRVNSNYLDVFPNPTTGKMTWRSSAKPEFVQLVNSKGQTVKRFDGNEAEFDLSELDNGVYVLRALVNGRTLIRKIVKE
jgi:hypothetical protein